MIPKEYLLICPTCGKEIDCRDLGQFLSHGMHNDQTGKYECTESEDIEYSSSRKVGESVGWTKDKKPINLN